MLPTYESFIDATPEKGVIIVEYYWQPKAAAARGEGKDARVGTKTSMIFFKRVLAADKCWCGSKRQFSRCHRRSDDWSYVTLDPDQNAYSPVVLLERVYSRYDHARGRTRLEADPELLSIESTDLHRAWGMPIVPHIRNEIGELILGTLEIEPRGVHLETNSEKRFEHLTTQLEQVVGDALGPGETRRAEPQKTFPPPTRRRR